MSATRQIFKAMLTACVPRNRLLVRGPQSTDHRPRLALTFDDGPHPEFTPRLLDLLDELNLSSTFFVVGQNAEKYPGLIRRMIASGHEVANHTFTHSEPKLTSSATFLEEVERTDGLISELTSTVSQLVRPPKGELNLAKMRGLWRRQKTITLWNIDPKDFRMTGTNEIQRWCDSYEPKDGDIILLHDILPYAGYAIEMMSKKGVFERFEGTTVSCWLNKKNGEVP